MKGILEKGTVIDDLYTVKFFLKKGSYAESYRVKDREGATRFLKLFDMSKLQANQYTPDGKIREIEHLKKLEHRNTVAYLRNGGLTIDDKHYSWVVLEFISGETLAEKIKRSGSVGTEEAKKLVKGVLNGLDFLHTLNPPIVHNEITDLNIMTDLGGNSQKAKIIDFGYSRYFTGDCSDYSREGLDQIYLAPECLEGKYSEKSDIFSVGVLLYHLVFGMAPWSAEVQRHRLDSEKLEEVLAEERAQPLKFLSIGGNVDQTTLALIIKALKTDPNERWQSAKEFIQAIDGEIKLELKSDEVQAQEGYSAPPSMAGNVVAAEVRKGEGFKDIAGMADLKEMLKTDVIDALKEKEKYAEFGLTIPNGMLLYGPPGCGKTFFAEKFAEEIGFRFYQIKPSDLQSKYVNATQENIGSLFKEARENAPSIVFIDELDALVPDRNQPNMNHMSASAVNEFLAQMNNSGEAGVFVIGASNRPESIDVAITRAGRLDKTVYIPPPDAPARAEMFELVLSKRPIEGELDYGMLSTLTDGFMSSDIRFLCDEASRKALKGNSKITQSIMEEIIKANKPSISSSEVAKYEKIRDKMEGSSGNSRPSIGFRKD
ncbi:MAG: AAA family ATPase [Crocinitomicaceae bacterium]